MYLFMVASQLFLRNPKIYSNFLQLHFVRPWLQDPSQPPLGKNLIKPMTAAIPIAINAAVAIILTSPLSS